MLTFQEEQTQAESLAIRPQDLNALKWQGVTDEKLGEVEADISCAFVGRLALLGRCRWFHDE